MSVVPVLVVLSLALVGVAVVAFVYSVFLRDHEHADRLSLLPLEEDDASVKEQLTARVGEESPGVAPR